MDFQQYPEYLDNIVRRIFMIEDITHGKTEQGFVVRYRGHLISPDSEEAYNRLEELLKALSPHPHFPHRIWQASNPAHQFSPCTQKPGRPTLI